MVGKTHIAGGIALACVTASICPAFQFGHIGVVGTALYLSGTSFGAVLSDIDTDSTVSHYPVFNIISLIARIFRIVHHRGITHSLLAVLSSLLFGVLLGTFLGSGGFLFGAGMTIGIVSHIMLDMLNPTGVQLLYPLPMKISLAGITTGKLGDFLVRVGCIFAIIGILPRLF